MVKKLVLAVLVWFNVAAVHEPVYPTCGEVIGAAREVYETQQGKNFLGMKLLPGSNGLMAAWAGDGTTDVLLFVIPGRELEDSKLFHKAGNCTTPKGEITIFYVGSAKMDPT